MKSISLNNFLLRNHPIELSDESVLKILLTDSQELLLLINSILLSDLFNEHDNVPANISGNVYMGLEKPSLGKLLNLAFWLSQNIHSEKNKRLKEYLLIDERKKQGWITKLLQLRNAYAHPKGQTKEEVIIKAHQHIKDLPDLSDLGSIEHSPTPIWYDESGDMNLFPFVNSAGEELNIFTEFVYPDTLVFNPSNEEASNAFSKAWNVIKSADRTLYRPSNDDLLTKIKKAYLSNIYEGETPKWMSEFYKSSRIGMIIEPGLADGILGNLNTFKSQSLIIDIRPEGDIHPMECMRNDLEMLNYPDLTQLNFLASKDSPLVIVIRASDISSSNFLQAIYMIADVYDSGKNPHFKFFIERDKGKLQEEQDQLWDDLPDNMDKMFRKYTTNNSYELSDYLWGRKGRNILSFK